MEEKTNRPSKAIDHGPFENRKTNGYGSGTITALRGILASMRPNDYLLKSIREACEREVQAKPPKEPDRNILNSLFGCMSEEEACSRALEFAQRNYKNRKANGQAALDYLEVLESQTKELSDLPYLAEALIVYNKQFSQMAQLLGIDIDQPSNLESGLTIREHYQRTVTPIAENLTGLFFGDNRQATIHLRPSLDEEVTWGSYFPFAVYDDVTALKVRLDNGQTKTHEDFHFLTVSLKGKEAYYKDLRLGMIGEGLTPVFELWFYASQQLGEVILNREPLKTIDDGRSPTKLCTTDAQPTEANFWASAKTETVLKEHSGTTRISAEIMKLLSQNRELTFSHVCRAFLESQDESDFYDRLETTGKAPSGFEEFRETVKQLSRLPRGNI